MKDSLAAILTAVTIILLLLLLLSCGAIAYLILSQPSGEGPPAENGSQNVTPPPSSVNGTTGMNISEEDISLWNSITTGNVEQACLLRAKQEAGANADMVYSCKCDETLETDRKIYTCDIDTADPFTRYFADIGCDLKVRSCDIETNYGRQNVTFEELRDWYTD